MLQIYSLSCCSLYATASRLHRHVDVALSTFLKCFHPSAFMQEFAPACIQYHISTA